MSSPSVEVKCLETFAYYPAFLRDYDNHSQVLVSYPDQWKKDEWVPIENVRNAPTEFDASTFTPVAGDIIEAQAKSSDDEPFSWWRATVKTVRGDFYMIAYSSWEDEFNEILEKDMLRPANKNPPLKTTDLKKLEMPLPSDLRNSGNLDTKALNSVLETSGAMSVHIDPKKQCLVILGNTVSVKRASLLAGMAFKHLGEIQRLTERKAKHQSNLNELKQRLNEGHLETFDVQKDLIALVIGMAGKNIKRVEKMPGVLNVRVDSAKNQVSILAKSEEEAKAAREQLEFVEQRFPILKRQAGRVVGKSFSNMDQIQKDSGVVRIRLDTNKPTDDPNATVDLIIIGTKETVADALLLLNHHMEFLNTVNQLSGEERELNDEVRKMNLEAGIYEAEQQRGFQGRGGYGGGSRGARAPRPQGNRNYVQAQADFPPLSASASSSSSGNKGGNKPQAASQQPDAEESKPASQGAPTRGGRGGGRGGRGGRGGGNSERQQQGQGQQQQSQTGGDPQQRKPQQQQQQKPSEAAASSPNPSGGDSTSRRGGRGGGGGRGGRQQGGQNAQAASSPAAPADASAPASSPQPPREKKERGPKQPRGPKPDGAVSSPSGDAAGSPDPSKPRKEGGGNRRNERRPRQPADGAASPAAAPTAASPPAAGAAQ